MDYPYFYNEKDLVGSNAKQTYKTSIRKEFKAS